MIRRLAVVALALACVAAPAHAQTPKKKKTQSDIAGAQQKMLDAATKAKATGCSTSLSSHVYHPTRLQVYSNCITVTGTIVDATADQGTHRADGVRKEDDGDTHGWPKLDPGFEGLLNTGNMTDEGGNLVFEIVCYFTPLKKNAAATVACASPFKNGITLPPLNSHVEMTWRYVRDDNHQHWMEIHPVSRITVIQ